MATTGEQQPGKTRPAVRRPDLDTMFSINPDGSRNTIHPADVRGRWQVRKNLLWIVLIGVYLAVPWIEIGGRPAVLIDIGRRHFYLFGNTFNAQDFWLAFFFVSGLGFALFVVAALWGRLWCGYACPQTVFLEGVFRRIERWIDGSAPARVRLDKAPWTAGKFLRRILKHGIFLAIAMVMTHSFLGYFMPVEELVRAVTSPPGEHLTAFLFMAVGTGIIYFDFAWFREQVCIVICPYGRLQGALYDQDTVVVGYDQKRGEPRGAVGTEGAGACVDCYRCVVVCPTGIDIRNGNQMECVGCANCIDACDEVMDRLGRDRGLIRYDSQQGLEGGRRRFWRGRVAVYGALLLLGLLVFLFAASRRTEFDANLIRMPGPAFLLESGMVRNSFTLHLVNKLPEARTFTLEGRAPAGGEVVVAQQEVRLESLADARIAVICRVPREAFDPGVLAEVIVRTGDLQQTASMPLAGPPARR